MITYYLDATIDPRHPRLVRRINNGHPTTFNNTLGTAVAMDIENLQLSLRHQQRHQQPRQRGDDRGRPDDRWRVRPVACAPTQIRKVNIALSGRSTATQEQHDGHGASATRSNRR